MALVGPSRWGTTTLLKIGAGPLAPDRATAHLAGGSDAGVGHVPQADALLPWRDALGNALLGAEVAGRPFVHARAEAWALFRESVAACLPRR